MARPSNESLTKADILPLMARAGFTDISAQHPDKPLAVRDPDGNAIFYPDLASAREHLTLQWLIQQNS